MSNNGYNTDLWQKKIQKYLAENWSKRPSQFIQLSAEYLAPGSKVIELGSGAGQDGIWLESQGFNVLLTDGDDTAFDEIQKRAVARVKTSKVDITKPLPFEDHSFDAVYAQQVLHYFDDQTMTAIMKEIERVLKPDGILACMVNSTNDSEYEKSLEDSNGLIVVDGFIKRYFSLKSFEPFIKNFTPLLFDVDGRTPKDDAKENSGMIRFIGRLH